MSSAPVVLQAELNDQSRHLQLNHMMRKPKTVTPFLKWNINMPMQSQVLSMLHMLQRMSEKYLSTNYLAVKHPKHNKLRVLRIREKPVIFFSNHQPW